MVLDLIIASYQATVKKSFLIDDKTRASLLADIKKVRVALSHLSLKEESIHYFAPEKRKTLANRLSVLVMQEIIPILQASDIKQENAQEFHRSLIRAFLRVFATV